MNDEKIAVCPTLVNAISQEHILKLGTNVHLDLMVNRLDFGNQRSKVTVT